MEVSRVRAPRLLERRAAAPRLPDKGAVAGRGHPIHALPDRGAERRAQRLLPPGCRRSPRGRAGQRGPLEPRRAARPPRRRAGVDQGRPADPGHADPSWLAHGEPRPAVGGRCSRGRAPARARRGDPRQDHHPGARAQVRHGQPAHRHHPQPVEPRAQPRREQRGRRGRGGGGARSAGGGDRRRRLDPHPGDVERHRRPQADRGPRPDVAPLALGRALARGAAGPVRGGRRPPPHGAGRTRPARSGGPASGRPRLPDRARGRRGRAARRLQPRSRAGGGRAGDRRRRGSRGPGARAARRPRDDDQAAGNRGDRAGAPHLLHGHLRPVPRGADTGAARPPRSLPARRRRGGPDHHRGGLPRGPDDAPGHGRPDGGALRGPRSPRAAGLPRSAAPGAGPARGAPGQGACPHLLGEPHRPAGGERPLRAHERRASHRHADRRAALRRRAGAEGGPRLRGGARPVRPSTPGGARSRPIEQEERA